MTTNDRALVNLFIRTNGIGDAERETRDNPRAVRITEYTNAWGGTCWGIVFNGNNLDTYAESEYVRNPKIIWEYTP